LRLHIKCLLNEDESHALTLNPLTWKIWRAPNNASRWQMGFNSVFKGLISGGQEVETRRVTSLPPYTSSKAFIEKFSV